MINQSIKLNNISKEENMDKKEIREGLEMFFEDGKDSKLIIDELVERPIPIILEWMKRPSATISLRKIIEATSLEELQSFAKKELKKNDFYEKLRNVDKQQKKGKLREGN